MIFFFVPVSYHLSFLCSASRRGFFFLVRFNITSYSIILFVFILLFTSHSLSCFSSMSIIQSIDLHSCFHGMEVLITRQRGSPSACHCTPFCPYFPLQYHLFDSITFCFSLAGEILVLIPDVPHFPGDVHHAGPCSFLELSASSSKAVLSGSVFF